MIPMRIIRETSKLWEWNPRIDRHLTIRRHRCTCSTLDSSAAELTCQSCGQMRENFVENYQYQFGKIPAYEILSELQFQIKTLIPLCSQQFDARFHVQSQCTRMFTISFTKRPDPGQPRQPEPRGKLQRSQRRQ